MIRFVENTLPLGAVYKHWLGRQPTQEETGSARFVAVLHDLLNKDDEEDWPVCNFVFSDSCYVCRRA